jgi:hypothetical protein
MRLTVSRLGDLGAGRKPSWGCLEPQAGITCKNIPLEPRSCNALAKTVPHLLCRQGLPPLAKACLPPPISSPQLAETARVPSSLVPAAMTLCSVPGGGGAFCDQGRAPLGGGGRHPPPGGEGRRLPTSNMTEVIRRTRLASSKPLNLRRSASHVGGYMPAQSLSSAAQAGDSGLS